MVVERQDGGSILPLFEVVDWESAASYGDVSAGESWVSCTSLTRRLAHPRTPPRTPIALLPTQGILAANLPPFFSVTLLHTLPSAT